MGNNEHFFKGLFVSLALICASGAKALVCAMRTKFYKQNLYKMKSLKIGDLLARIPIIQGGMGVGISLSGLASAVANEGGVGVISSAGLGVIYKEHSNDYNEAFLFCILQRKTRRTFWCDGFGVLCRFSIRDTFR